MSDIIYTPPASGGGGTTINPTNNFIPKRSNATTFVNSVLENGSNYLYSNYGGYTGLGLDFLNFVSYLGDWNNLINGTTLVVNDATSNIFTKYNGFAVGINLNLLNNIYTLGDTSNGFTIDINNNYGIINIGSNTFFIADNSTLSTKTGGSYTLTTDNTGVYTDKAGTLFGLKADFVNKISALGDYNLVYNKTFLTIDDGIKSIFLGNWDGDTTGLSYYRILDTNPNSCYASLGDPADGLGFQYQNSDTPTNDYLALTSNYAMYLSSTNNGLAKLQALGTNNNSISLDPVSDKISFTTNNLNYVGTSLQSNTSSGSSGEHLVITLNGNQYKIDLKNP